MPRHFHRMMSPQFFSDPNSGHNRRYSVTEKKIESFFSKLLKRFKLKK
jgi:hypothetical protein